jgi:SAM-dependent methyltransferase
MIHQHLLKRAKVFVRYLRTWIDPYLARIRFYLAPLKPEWLSYSVLESLQSKYPQPDWKKYDDASIICRGEERAIALEELLGKKFNCIHDTLEIGCWDGMVSAFLQKAGKNTAAVDRSSEGFHTKAFQAGVNLLQMDAAQMHFPDESFDLIFSHDAFEHFRKPEKVFPEIVRLLRKKGLVYLSFGPLYLSPLGLHADASVTVPYCQNLFTRKILEDFVESKKLVKIDFEQVNTWTLAMYRKLFRSHSDLKVLRYYEIHDPRHLEIIAKYPSCFKSKTNHFDEFTVAAIEVLLQRV